MVASIKNQLKPKTFYEKPLNKSKGILDDHAVRKSVNTREGRITHTPTHAKDIVNKEYVDAAAGGGGITLFLTEDASGDVAGYMSLVPFPTGNAEENTVTAISSAADVEMEQYATEVGCECVTNLESLPAGVVDFHVHAKAAQAGIIKLYFKLYKRDNLDVETLLGTSESTGFLTTASLSYVIHATLATETTWVSTDRVVIKLFGSSTNAAAKNLTYYVEGDTASRVGLTGNVPVGNNVTSTSVLTDHYVVRGDGGARGVQTTGIFVDDAGRVGIGTSTLDIDSILEVFTADRCEYRVSAGANAGSRAVMQLKSTAYANLHFGDQAADAAGGFLYTHATDTLDFRTANTNQMSLNSSGQLQLISQRITDQSSARAYKNATQSVNTGTLTTVDFNVESYDNDDEFNLTTDTFTAAEDGTFLVTTCVGFSTMADGDRMEVFIYDGATPRAKAELTAGNTGNHVLTCSTILDLSATDTVLIKVEHNHGSARDILGSESETNVCIQKLT